MNDSYGSLEKDQIMFALNDNFPNLDGKITAKLEGRVGICTQILKLVAADNMEEIATVGKDKNGEEIVDSRMLGALRIRENARMKKL